MALDALQARLNTEDYAPELRAQLAALERSRREVGYDSAQHDRPRGSSLSTLRPSSSTRPRCRLRCRACQRRADALAAAEERRARNQAAQQSAAQQIDRLERDIERLEEGLGAQRERQAEVARTQAEARQTGQALVSEQQELAALESMRARREQLQQRADVVHHEAGLYRELRRAFSRDGVPAMLIDSAIPELEANANALLLRMTDGRLKRPPEHHARAPAPAVKSIRWIFAWPTNWACATTNCSAAAGPSASTSPCASPSRACWRGGPARGCARSLSTRGLAPRMPSGRERLVEAIAAIQPDFDLILVITHIEELRERFPRHILVEKHAEGSRLRLQ